EAAPTAAGPPCLAPLPHPRRGDDLPWRAVSALQGVVLDERALEWMQIPVGGEPRGRDDLRTLVRDRKGETAVRPPPVQQDGAGATLPVVTALLGAGDPQTVAQGIQYRRAGVHGQPVLSPVHAERDFDFHGHPLPILTGANACTHATQVCERAGTPAPANHQVPSTCIRLRAGLGRKPAWGGGGWLGGA